MKGCVVPKRFSVLRNLCDFCGARRSACANIPADPRSPRGSTVGWTCCDPPCPETEAFRSGGRSKFYEECARAPSRVSPDVRFVPLPEGLPVDVPRSDGSTSNGMVVSSVTWEEGWGWGVLTAFGPGQILLMKWVPLRELLIANPKLPSRIENEVLRDFIERAARETTTTTRLGWLDENDTEA